MERGLVMAAHHFSIFRVKYHPKVPPPYHLKLPPRLLCLLGVREGEHPPRHFA